MHSSFILIFKVKPFILKHILCVKYCNTCVFEHILGDMSHSCFAIFRIQHMFCTKYYDIFYSNLMIAFITLYTIYMLT